MPGPPNPLNQRKQKAVTAILGCPTLVAADREADIPKSTLYRWLAQDDFQWHLRQARRRSFSRMIGRLQQVSERAVAALDSVMADEKAAPATRVNAARAALRYSYHGIEVDDFEQRLSDLEHSRQLIEEENMNDRR